MPTPSIRWAALIPVIVLILVNKSLAQQQKSNRAPIWDILVPKADPPPPTGSIWDIPVPKAAPILPSPESNGGQWENLAFSSTASVSSESSSPPCSCTLEYDNGSDDNCVVYGSFFGSLVPWFRATNTCIEDLGFQSRTGAHAEANLLCPVNVTDENMDVLKFVELLQGYPSSSIAQRVKQLYLDTGVFVEANNGAVDMADKISLQQGPVLDCTTSPLFCWKEIEATFERNKQVLLDLCGQLQEEKVADLQQEQQNVRIELCGRGEEDSARLPAACRALWQQIHDEKANFPNSECSAFGQGPGDVELPTCSNSIAIIAKDVGSNTTLINEASAAQWQLNHTDPINDFISLSPLVPNSNATEEESVGEDGELCPCNLRGDDEEQCRVYGVSPSGEKSELIFWHPASYRCLKSLNTTIPRSVNPSRLRKLCPDQNTADPFHFVEFIRKRQNIDLSYRVSQLFVDKAFFVEQDNGEIVLSDTITLFSGHVLDCKETPMACWNEIEYEFRQSSNLLQNLCLEILEEETIQLQKEQQEARVLLCAMDAPAPQECKLLWEQVKEEKAAFPDVGCMAFGQGLGDAQLATCSSSNDSSSVLLDEEAQSATSRDPSTAESTKFNASSSLASEAKLPYATSGGSSKEVECPCSFDLSDEKNCRVYGMSVTESKNETKNQLKPWHPANDICLEELVRAEINLLCPNGTANVTAFANLVFMDTSNTLSLRTKQKFLDTAFFVEKDNGTIAVTDSITGKSGVTQNCTATPMFCWNELKFEFEEKISRLEKLCSELRTSPPTIDKKTGQEWARVVLCERNVNNTVPEQCRPLGEQIKEEQELYPSVLCSAFGKGLGDTRLPACNVTDRPEEPLPPTSTASEPDNFTAVRFTGISMVLDGVGSLDQSATKQWAATTVNFYESVHNEESATGGQLATAGIRDFSTFVSVQDESVTGSSVTIVYTTQVKYVKTSPDGPTSWELIKNPLKDSSLNQRYAEALRTSHSAFANLEGVGVPFILPPSATSRGNSNNDNDGSHDEGGIKTGAIIGFVVLALCAFTVGYAAYRHLRMGKQGSSIARDEIEDKSRTLRVRDERSRTSSKGAVSNNDIDVDRYSWSSSRVIDYDDIDDGYSSTSEILDSILSDHDETSLARDSKHMFTVAPCMSEDTEGADLECQMYATRTIPPSKTPDAVPVDEQSSLPLVVCTGMVVGSPRKKSFKTQFKKKDSALKIDCCDYDHVFGDNHKDDAYLATNLQSSTVGDVAKSQSTPDATVDDPAEEAGGDGYEGDVENPLPDSPKEAHGGASRTSSSSSTSNTPDNCNTQQSSLRVSPSKTFVNIHPETDSTRTGGEKETSSHNPSDTASGMYFDDDNVVVAIEDTAQQQVSPQLEKSFLGSREDDTTRSSDSNSIDKITKCAVDKEVLSQHDKSCLSSRDEDTTSSDSKSSTDNNKRWPVDEELIEIEAPPGWLGVVIDTSDPTGPPLVYEIKKASPMRNVLQVGDKIIAVDNQDVTQTSAPDVSKLINQRATNPIRRFRILREFFADEFETQRQLR